MWSWLGKGGLESNESLCSVAEVMESKRAVKMTSNNESRGVNNSELLYRAFLCFWLTGLSSALLDLDHIWKYFGMEEPFNLTGWFGRPLHHPMVLLLVSIILGGVLVALGLGRNVAIPIWLIDEQNSEKHGSQEIEV